METVIVRGSLRRRLRNGILRRGRFLEAVAVCDDRVTGIIEQYRGPEFIGGKFVNHGCGMYFNICKLERHCPIFHVTFMTRSRSGVSPTCENLG